MYFNDEMFKKLDMDSYVASQWMAAQWGSPYWSDGTVRNCSRLAVAPTKSTALIMGGISEGINPDPAMTFTQTTAGGEADRINPTLLAIMKERGVYTNAVVRDLADNFGSVQHVEWLSDEEKKVFKTAFEIDQNVVVRLASQRAKYLDQWQSVNLFFAGDADPAYIVDVHKNAFKDENIRALYYIYSAAGVSGSKPQDCEVCS